MCVGIALNSNQVCIEEVTGGNSTPNSFFSLASCHYIFQNWLRISKYALFFALIFVPQKCKQNTWKWRKILHSTIFYAFQNVHTFDEFNSRQQQQQQQRKNDECILWFQINAVSNPKWNLIAQPKLLIHFTSHKFFALSTNLFAQNEF